MKRGRLELSVLSNRFRLLQILMGVILVYFLFMSFEIPLVLRTRLSSLSPFDVPSGFLSDALPRPMLLDADEEQLANSITSIRPSEEAFRVSQGSQHRKPKRQMYELKKISGLIFNDTSYDANEAPKNGFSVLQKAARHAWMVGKKLLEEVESGKIENETKSKPENRLDSCPHSISLSGSEFLEQKGVMVLPCGLTLWSHLTVVGTPRWAHAEHDPKIAIVKEGDDSVMVSQFMMELQGLKTVDNEEPPRILHFNPRLKGDWSGKPVIEQNTCYRMQWGSALRCEGWKSRADEETVDGQVKCEKWIRDDDNHSEESKVSWWLNRLIGRKKKVTVDWPYPFAEGKLFVITISAGLEGYHVNVDGKHVTSFPYRTVGTLIIFPSTV